MKVAFKAFDSASLRPRPHLKLLSCLEGEAFLFLDLFVPGATLPGVKDNGAYVPKMVEPWVDVQRNILHRVAHIDWETGRETKTHPNQKAESEQRVWSTYIDIRKRRIDNHPGGDLEYRDSKSQRL